MRLQHLISLQSLTTFFSNSYEASFSQLLMLQTIEVKPQHQKGIFLCFWMCFLCVCVLRMSECLLLWLFFSCQTMNPYRVTWIRRYLAALPFLHSDSLLNFLFLILRWKQNYPPEWNEVYRFVNVSCIPSSPRSGLIFEFQRQSLHENQIDGVEMSRKQALKKETDTLKILRGRYSVQHIRNEYNLK